MFQITWCYYVQSSEDKEIKCRLILTHTMAVGAAPYPQKTITLSQYAEEIN